MEKVLILTSNNNPYFVNDLILGILLCLVPVFICIYIVVNNYLLKKQENLMKENSIFNTFPCETRYLLNPKPRLFMVYFFLFIFIYSLGCTTSFCLNLCNLYYSTSSLDPVGIIIMVVNVLMFVFMYFMYLFNISNMKKHIYFTIIFILSEIILYSCVFIYSLSSLNKSLNITDYSVNIYVGSISLFFGIVLLGFLVNPKLKQRNKKNKTEVNGVTYYTRPKINVLAFTEWYSFINIGLISLLFGISSLLLL